MVGRYKAALERRRRARGLPDDAGLEKIQRYEAHLERGMHKALDRLRDPQEARRGAVAPRGPSVAVAVVQGGTSVGTMGPFGNFALEASAEGVEGSDQPDRSSLVGDFRKIREAGGAKTPEIATGAGDGAGASRAPSGWSSRA